MRLQSYEIFRKTKKKNPKYNFLLDFCMFSVVYQLFPHKNLISMVCQEVFAWQKLRGQGHLSAIYATEMQIIVFLRLVLSKCRGETHRIVVGQYGDESFVESIVIERKETDAVAGI